MIFTQWKFRSSHRMLLVKYSADPFYQKTYQLQFSNPKILMFGQSGNQCYESKILGTLLWKKLLINFKNTKVFQLHWRNWYFTPKSIDVSCIVVQFRNTWEMVFQRHEVQGSMSRSMVHQATSEVSSLCLSPHLTNDMRVYNWCTHLKSWQLNFLVRFYQSGTFFFHYPWQVVDKIGFAATETGACRIYHPELLHFWWNWFPSNSIASYCKWIGAPLFRVDEFIKCDEFDEKLPVQTE